MQKQHEMVDGAKFDPDLKQVPFPPAPGDYERAEADKNTPRRAPAPGGDKPYYESYDPDIHTFNTAEATPGAPDIRNPHAKIPEGFDMDKLSPGFSESEKE